MPRFRVPTFFPTALLMAGRSPFLSLIISRPFSKLPQLFSAGLPDKGRNPDNVPYFSLLPGLSVTLSPRLFAPEFLNSSNCRLLLAPQRSPDAFFRVPYPCFDASGCQRKAALCFSAPFRYSTRLLTILNFTLGPLLPVSPAFL